MSLLRSDGTLLWGHCRYCLADTDADTNTDTNTDSATDTTTNHYPLPIRVHDVAWSPSGATLAYCCHDSSISLASFPTGSQALLTEDPPVQRILQVKTKTHYSTTNTSTHRKHRNRTERNIYQNIFIFSYFSAVLRQICMYACMHGPSPDLNPLPSARHAIPHHTTPHHRSEDYPSRRWCSSTTPLCSEWGTI